MSGVLETLASVLNVRTFVLRDALVKAGVASGAYHASKALERIIYGKEEKTKAHHGGARRLVAPEGRKTTRLKEEKTFHHADDEAVSSLNAKVLELRNQIDGSERTIHNLYANHEAMGTFQTSFGNAERQRVLEIAVTEGKKVFQWKHELADAETQLATAAARKAASVSSRSEALTPDFRRYARDFRRRQRAIRVVKESYLTKYARRKKKW